MKLYMDSVDAAVFGGSDISIVLIGGFAGYSNFGDILQVLSALDFYKCKLPHACIAVAIDAEAQEIWQKSLPPRFKNIAMPIYMVENGHAHNAPTVPDGWSDQLTLPGAFILHFYGGGYVAPEWGPRKRLAGEYFLSLCKAVGIKAHVYFSGIQVTDDAEACLWRDLWSHASIIGARDPTSLTICKQVLGNGADAKLFLQGDDALPPLSWMLQRRTSASSVRRNCIGVHVSAAYYSTGDRAARLEVLADTAEALASALGPGGEFVGLIAYQDQQVDENIYFQEFEDLVKSRENILLSDWSYSRLLLQECVIRERIEMPFNLVVTCSYHIAYAALTAGIPVIFILDLPYYRQKCDGLLHHFDADRLLLIGLGGKKGREITEFLRDTKEAMYNPSVAKQWFSLTQVRSKIGKAVSEIEAARKAQTFEDILTNYRESALALGELRRRVILMERYEANLQAEIAALRDRSFLIAPKKEVRKLKQEWRRIREQLGLRKRKATTQ